MFCICQALVPNLPIVLRGGRHSIGALLGVVRRVRKVGGVKSRREGRSTPGPGLVVVDRRTSEGRPGRMEGWWRLRGNKNFDLVQIVDFQQLQTIRLIFKDTNERFSFFQSLPKQF